MIQKRILQPGRVRCLPKDGWAWHDRRFVREFAPALSMDAILVYFFLVSVCDKHGLSFYSDALTAARLHIEPAVVDKARRELLAHDLIAFQAPLTQVLSLPSPRRGGVHSLAEILRSMP